MRSPLRSRILAPLALALPLGVLALESSPGSADAAGDPHAKTPPDADKTPAVKYGAMDRAACEAELTKRGIAFTRADARGVLAPVRLSGPLRGVTYRTELPKAERATSAFEIVDCRLALALDDFAALLAKHDVVEVLHFSVYRPPRKDWPAGKLATRHPGGLAIDAGKLVKKDGSILNIEKHFNGKIGTETCGPGTGPAPVTPEATTLRQIVCEAADLRLFNVQLTPDYNFAHRNHFHLEVTPNVKWFLVH